MITQMGQSLDKLGMRRRETDKEAPIIFYAERSRSIGQVNLTWSIPPQGRDEKREAIGPMAKVRNQN